MEYWEVNKFISVSIYFGIRQHIIAFLKKFGKDLKSGNVLTVSDEEKWKKLEEENKLDREEKKEENKDSKDTGYEAWHGNPPQ